MPRPAARRNRLVLKNSATLVDQNPLQVNHEIDQSKANIAHNSGMTSSLQKDDAIDTHGLPSRTRDGVPSSSQLPGGRAPASETRRQIRNWTPTTKAQEQAIESSPMGERLATGSRPPARARGYSSTMSLAGRNGDMSSRIPGTPAFENSILSNFRRRPRQPSILQMMQADDDASDLGDDDDFLGDISPQDESTPLDRTRGKPLILKSPATSPSGSPLPTPSVSRKRGRDIEELQVPQSPLGVVEDTLSASLASERGENQSLASVEIRQSLEPLEVISQMRAPPMSSSPPLSPAEAVSALNIKQSPYAMAKRMRRPKTRATGETSESRSHLSTAALQQKLLPRRRQCQRQPQRSDATDIGLVSDDSESHYPGSGLDDDELSYLPCRKSSQTKTNHKAKPKPKPLTIAQGRSGLAGQENQKEGRVDSSRDVNNTDLTARSRLSKRPIPRERVTYSSCSRRKTNMDKENQEVFTSSPLSSPLDSDAFDSDSLSPNSQPAKKFIGEELQLQAKKFAEIDQWQMEFEDVTAPPSSQSG